MKAYLVIGMMGINYQVIIRNQCEILLLRIINWRDCMITERPLSHEYDKYYERYITLVPSGDLVQIYSEQLSTFHSLLSGLTEDKAEFRFEEGKWSIKEIVGHLCDAERMLSYVTFQMIRKDDNLISSINFNDYVIRGNYHNRSILNLLEEFKSVRKSTISLINTIRNEDLQLGSTFRQHPLTVLAAVCIIVGHVEHHMRILRKCYRI
ncbi:DinB family protein [Bacillus sp. BGMRC 2118]|nr:DinB family protein [Bacillus sp. BGMRC 2118]